MDEIKVNIASNIIRLRTSAGMTQLDLAGRLNYSDKAVSKWERAESVPDIYVIKQIADVFGVSVDYLIAEHTEWEKPPTLKEQALRPKVLSALTTFGIFTAALIVFVILWIFGTIRWSIFVYMLPIMAITLLVFNSIWNGGKGNVFFTSAILWSVFASLYVMLLEITHTNLWQMLIVVLPAQLVTIFSFHLRKKRKE